MNSRSKNELEKTTDGLTLNHAKSQLTLEQAIEIMKQSRTIIFPTETFFGLGSRALDPGATAKVFRAKNRSTVRPLPLILGDWSQLEQVAKPPASVMPLLQHFWPGPLSVILQAPLRVPDILTGGTGCVAVRVSSHPVARALALGIGEPITASSANISGQSAVTCVADLAPQLLANVDGVLDLPPVPAGGLPSTLVEVVGDHALRVLREGAISREALCVLGFEVVA